MAEDTDITLWLNQLAQGDELAAQRIWEHYFQRLCLLARRKLGDAPRRMADEEDVVLSAFNSFCQAAAIGRFPQLNDRHDLWQVLVMITVRKAISQFRHEHYQKRGGGVVRGESVFLGAGSTSDVQGIGKVLGDEPTPEFAAAVSEQCSRLLGLLDESLRTVALWKLEGYTNEEIATKLNCVTTTVERKLARIRKAWDREVQP